MEKINEMKTLIKLAESQGYDFYRKNNLKAGVRYRQLLNQVKILAQEIRMEALVKKKVIADLRYQKKRSNDFSD